MILNKKQNPYSSSIVGYWPLKSDLNSRTTGVSAATIARASAAHFITGNGTLASKASGAARFETRGLLVEKAATNNIKQSIDLSDSGQWAELNGDEIVTSGFSDPKGGTSAFKIEAVTPSLTAAILQTADIVNAPYDSLSVWLKADENMSIAVGAGAQEFNVTTEWKRYKFESAGGVNIASFGILSPTAGQYFYAYGPQVESGYQTSYIETAAAYVTRAGDVISLPSGIVPAVSNDFAIAIDVLVKNAPTTLTNLLNFAGETNGRIVAISNDLKVSTSYGGVTALSGAAVFTEGRRHRVLFTGNNTVYKVFIDGVLSHGGNVGGSGVHTSIKINDSLDGVLQVRDVIAYNRYFSTAAEALNELKYHG
jgi:hypothetical protein